MKKRTLFGSLALTLLLGVGLIGCTPAQEPEPEPEPQQEVKINVTAAGNKTTLIVGETVQLSADVQGVTWRSLATDVASVSADGLVTALKAGDAMIRASKDGYKNGSITITVTKAPEKQAKYKIDFEKADHIAASADGRWGMNYGGTWYGPDDPYSPVESSQGTTEDGTSLGWLNQGCKEILTFTSDKAVKVVIGASMARSASEELANLITAKFNGVAMTLSGTLDGAEEGAAEQYHNWHNIEYGEVDLIAGNNVLEIEVIAQTGPNLNEFLVFTEEELTLEAVLPAQKVKIEVQQDSFDLVEEETANIVVTNAEGVAFASSNANVATVDADGKITAMGKGTATINVTKDGMLPATVTVNVTAKPVSNQMILAAADAILVEAEEGAANPVAVEADHGNIGYFSAGDTATWNFTIAAAQKATLLMSAAFASEVALDETIQITVNGVAVDLTGKVVPAGTNSCDYYSFNDVNLGEVDLVAGENVLVITAIAQAPNIECMKLNLGEGGGTQPVRYEMTFNEENTWQPVGDPIPNVPDPEKFVDGIAYYWADQNWCGSNVTMGDHYVEDGVLHASYTESTGACDFGVQLFIKNRALEAGKNYEVSFKVTASKAAAIKMNDTGDYIALAAETEQEVKVQYTEIDTMSSFKFIVKINDDFRDNSFVIKDIAWEEVHEAQPMTIALDQTADLARLEMVDGKPCYVVRITYTGDFAENTYVMYNNDDTLPFVKAEHDATRATVDIFFDISGLALGAGQFWPHLKVNGTPWNGEGQNGDVKNDAMGNGELEGAIEYNGIEYYINVAYTMPTIMNRDASLPRYAIKSATIVAGEEGKPQVVITGTCKNATAEMFAIDFQLLNVWTYFNLNCEVAIDAENGTFRLTANVLDAKDGNGNALVDGQYVFHITFNGGSAANLGQYTGFEGTSVAYEGRTYGLVGVYQWWSNLIFLEVGTVAE
jgi:hypothetical protein